MHPDQYECHFQVSYGIFTHGIRWWFYDRKAWIPDCDNGRTRAWVEQLPDIQIGQYPWLDYLLENIEEAEVANLAEQTFPEEGDHRGDLVKTLIKTVYRPFRD